MQITRQMELQGNWLFRWRSYLPLVLLPLLVGAIIDYQRPFHSDQLHYVWSFFCLGISLLGLAIRCLTVGQVPARTSGRNTRCQIADRLNTLGVYSTVRHPLYLANFCIGLGVALAPFHAGLPIIYSLAFWLYYERIIAAEEAFLAPKFGKEYEAWVAKTPAFLPDLSLWKPAELPFSHRTVLKREYTGFFLVVALHTGVQLAKQHTMTGHLQVDPYTGTAFVAAASTYVVLRTLKKRTGILAVQGR